MLDQKTYLPTDTSSLQMTSETTSAVGVGDEGAHSSTDVGEVGDEIMGDFEVWTIYSYSPDRCEPGDPSQPLN